MGARLNFSGRGFLSSSPEVHANTAETLGAIIRNTPSGLSVKLSIPSDLSSTSEEKLDKVNLTGANGGSISRDV
ncbi:hypothetical protein C5167_003209 [Papaver somniferum]|uniref:Uncharacterized protein n=1 Tax=Papaver somniferum TaxID=3469 RepID=A0A4Y7L405_PAPSO|nr:hypothetical protein C5167_003209 [Papaver somniferum]